MNRMTKCAIGLLVASFCSMAQASPPTVNPEPMALDPDVSAKILLEKSKQRSTGAPGAASSNSSNCGTVNIGNSTSGDTKSISGIKDMFGKQNITVVNGPVINTANCK